MAEKTKTSEKASNDLTKSKKGDLALPGQSKVDKTLIDKAVQDLNALYTAKGLELARAIGEYILKTFFGGKFENLEADQSHVSWRALAKREDLQMSYSTLWSSVAVLGQLRQLPEDIGEALTVSHHRRLVAITDVGVKLRIAKKAAKQGMTIKQLEAEIASYRSGAKTSNRGRPALSGPVKALRRLPNLIEPLTEYAVSADDVETLGIENAEELLGSLEEQIETLQAARSEIQEALSEAKQRE